MSRPASAGRLLPLLRETTKILFNGLEEGGQFHLDRMTVQGFTNQLQLDDDAFEIGRG